nr:DUF3011 domain-containing protein [Vicinamibacterales bacterium]
TCQSEGRQEAFCPAAIGGNVELVRKMSDADCIQGRSWNWTRNGVTVWNGCRAEFAYSPRGGELPPDGPRMSRVTCQSEGGREAFCPAPIGGNVQVARQLSDRDCVYRRNWNWTENGVTVWDGCRAEFSYSRRGGELPPDGPRMSRVTCQSQGGREAFCPAPIAGDVRVARNLSDTRCREGQNWSWTAEGVRVWGGCRADFEFRSRR